MLRLDVAIRLTDDVEYSIDENRSSRFVVAKTLNGLVDAPKP
jgi:hypothetical protein